MTANDRELADRLVGVSTATLTMVLIKRGIRQSWTPPSLVELKSLTRPKGSRRPLGKNLSE